MKMFETIELSIQTKLNHIMNSELPSAIVVEGSVS